MPRTQIPLLSDLGFYTMADLPITDAIGSHTSFLNGYFEKGEDSAVSQATRKIAYVKRPGVNSVLTAAFTAGHKIQGFWTSIDRTKGFIYTNNGVTNTVWYWNGTTLANLGVAPAAVGNWTFTGPVVATLLDGVAYGAGNLYAVTDFSHGALVSSTGVWTEITVSNFTGLAKNTNFVALDGYLFMGTATNRIYNSDLNIPTQWSSTSFLNAIDTPGSIVWLTKVRNFLVAFKDKSIEFFENIGNPTPGSPLEPRKQYNRTVGCINKSSIKEMSDGIIFAGAAENSAPKLYKLNKNDLSIVEISSRYVEQCLANGYNFLYGVDSTADGGAKGQSQSFSYAGKEFYILNVRAPNLSSGDNPPSLVYDNSLGIWTEWASYFSGFNDTYGFLPSQAQMLTTTTSGTSAIGAVFANNSTSPPKLMVMDSLVNQSSGSGAYTDSGNPFLFKWISPVIDFGSRRRKFMDSFEVVYESYNAGADTPNFSSNKTMTLFILDNNYQAISSYRVQKTLPIDPGGALRCMCLQLGSFRRRVFVLQQQIDMALRIWAIEVDINLGETDEGG